MRILVTGGAGFIGSAVVEQLVAQGASVVVLDDLSTGSEGNLAAVRDRIAFHRDSILDPEALDRAVAGADCIIHLAARTSVPRSVAEPLETNRVNVEGTLAVLEAARRAGVRRVVYAASSSAYGDSATLPMVETQPPAPLSPYGVSKLAGELYAAVYTRLHGLETVALRYFNVYGPRQNPDSPYAAVLARFLAALADGEPPVVYGDGGQTRDFTYVEDAAAATVAACTATGASGYVINVAGGHPVSLREVLVLLEQITGRRVHPRYAPPRPGDIRHSAADLSRAAALLGWRPRVTLEEGLRRTWQWMLAHRAAGTGRAAAGTAPVQPPVRTCLLGNPSPEKPPHPAAYR